MTSEGLGEMFEGDSADTCGGKFPLVSMGGRAEGLACADTESRTPIGATGNYTFFYLLIFSCVKKVGFVNIIPCLLPGHIQLCQENGVYTLHIAWLSPDV